MTMNFNFVRGHMGGNLIVLLRGDQMPVGRELETAVQLLAPTHLHGHEAGILYSTGEPGQIEAKIAEPSLPCFISACGGFTQVLGAALIETDFGALFDVDQHASNVEIMLYTDGGPTNLSIDTYAGKSLRIRTNMDSFVKECYDRGIGTSIHKGLEVMQAGKFLVVNAERFKAAYPQIDLDKWDSTTRKILSDIQHEFQDKTGEIEPNVVVYDWQPQHGGHVRVVFPHYVDTDFFEPSCGTGSVALGVAMLAWHELEGLIPDREGKLVLKLESGGGRELGGPEFTALEMYIADGLVKSASFSHSRVEITSVGEARL